MNAKSERHYKNKLGKKPSSFWQVSKYEDPQYPLHTIYHMVLSITPLVHTLHTPTFPHSSPTFPPALSTNPHFPLSVFQKIHVWPSFADSLHVIPPCWQWCLCLHHVIVSREVYSHGLKCTNVSALQILPDNTLKVEVEGMTSFFT